MSGNASDSRTNEQTDVEVEIVHILDRGSKLLLVSGGTKFDFPESEVTKLKFYTEKSQFFEKGGTIVL